MSEVVDVSPVVETTETSEVSSNPTEVSGSTESKSEAKPSVDEGNALLDRLKDRKEKSKSKPKLNQKPSKEEESKEKPKEFSDTVQQVELDEEAEKGGSKVEDPKKEEFKKEKEKPKKEDKEPDKQTVDDDDEIDDRFKEADSSKDQQTPQDDDDDVPDSRDQLIRDMQKRMDEMDSRLEQSSKTKAEMEHQEQIERDRELVSNPFKYGFDHDKLQDMLSDDPEAQEFFDYDPEGTKHQLNLFSKVMNQFLDHYNDYGVANQRVNEYNEIQKQEELTNLKKNIEDRGIDLKTFQTKGYLRFEDSKDGRSFHEDFSKRFEGNDLEYALHMHDAYKSHQQERRAKTLTSKKEESKQTRDILADSQSKLDRTQIEAPQTPPTTIKDSDNLFDRLEKRKSKKR